MRIEYEANRTKRHVEQITADRPSFDLASHARTIAARRDIATYRTATGKTTVALDDAIFVWGVRIR